MSKKSSEEFAAEKSVEYRGYCLEVKEDGWTTVRRIAEKATLTKSAVVYYIAEYETEMAAKEAIDRAADHFGREIFEVDSPTKEGLAAISVKSLNSQLKEAGLWRDGMNRLTKEEKRALLFGDQSVLESLEEKLVDMN